MLSRCQQADQGNKDEKRLDVLFSYIDDLENDKKSYQKQL